jgi:DNA integrity scanning protein DisA with diadenylate cyclase activity
VAPSLIESLAHIDGAIVLDARSNILAFGAIVQPLSETPGALPAEGGRTTAAMLASRFGKALKISEDGIIGFYENDRCVWEI